MFLLLHRSYEDALNQNLDVTIPGNTYNDVLSLRLLLTLISPDIVLLDEIVGSEDHSSAFSFLFSFENLLSLQFFEWIKILILFVRNLLITEEQTLFYNFFAFWPYTDSSCFTRAHDELSKQS